MIDASCHTGRAERTLTHRSPQPDTRTAANAPPGCAGSRKDAVVAACLRHSIDETPRPVAEQLARKDLDAWARLRAVFRVEPTSRPDGMVRGCSFHNFYNAAVEAAGTTPEVAELVEQHKREFNAQSDPGDAARPVHRFQQKG
ncbi:hypothetical protein ACFWM5_39775 [Streptomyces bobili]|uniref:hypothetical protein n=1 Tax=Streptomyces bobili TaxID=67280 RepID=UPI0036683B12